jgi:hypothetical protein
MRFACQMSKEKYRHTQYLTLTAFSRKQWLSERASMLRHTYIACLVGNKYGGCELEKKAW